MELRNVTCRRLLSSFLAIALACGLVQRAAAQAVSLTITSSDADLGSITLSGNNVTDLINTAIQREDELRAFSGTDIQASMNYLGVPEAIQVAISADGTKADIVIPSTGFQKTFDEGSPDQLEDAIEDFMKTDGSEQVAAFQKEINKTSAAGVTDGNPLATTALLSNSLFQATTGGAVHPPSMQPRAIAVRAEARAWSSGDLSGQLYTLATIAHLNASPRSHWHIAAPLDYRSVSGAEIWGGSIGVAYNYDFVQPDAASPWGWTAGPVAGIAARGSEQLAAGGSIYNYGINSVVTYDLSDRARLGLAAQVTRFSDIPISVEDVELKTDIEQSIAEYGIHYAARTGKSLLTASLSGASFLESAAIDTYGVVRLGYSLPLGQSTRFDIQLSDTFADDFEVVSAKLGFSW